MSKEMRESDLNAPLIFTVGIASVVWVAVIVLFIRAWVFQQQDAIFETNFVRQTPRQLVDHQQDGLTRLNEHHVVVPDKMLVSMPIDQAIERYAEQQKNDSHQ